MTHTPGPWTLRDDRLSPQVWVETVTGATRIVRFGPRENWDAVDYANAQLIAEAPELLKELEELVELVKRTREGEYEIDCYTTEPALAVIAKARGRPKKGTDK